MKPDDLRAERDQARSDLAAERVASAEAARALEVARKALEWIVDSVEHPADDPIAWVFETRRDASRALRSMAGEKEGAA